MIAFEWNRDGPRVRRNPTCEMWVTRFRPVTRCGRPATIRVNRLPHWSLYWCPDHARYFEPGFYDRLIAANR